MRTRLLVSATLTSLVVIATPAAATSIPVTILNQSSVALTTDTDLVDPWGLGRGPARERLWPIWTAAGTGDMADERTSTKRSTRPVVSGGGPDAGSSGNGGFGGSTAPVTGGKGAVPDWRSSLGLSAEVLTAATKDNIYTGLATGSVGGHDYSYLANFETGSIDVLKGDRGAPDLPGNFTDLTLPPGYAPFSIQNLDGTLYVTYARRDADGRAIAEPGGGIVNRFGLDGTLLNRVEPDGSLNLPFGVAIAPPGVTGLGTTLPAGKVGDEHPNTYDPATGAPVQTIADRQINPIATAGLSGLLFGSGGENGNPRSLFFAAASGTPSLVGVTTVPSEEPTPRETPVPEPATMALVGAGLLVAAIRRLSIAR